MFCSPPTVAQTSNDPQISGLVGIGTTSPLSKLDISGAVVGKALVSFNETGDQNILVASASGTNRFVITNAGLVGIGTTNPTSNLTVVYSDSAATRGITSENYNSAAGPAFNFKRARGTENSPTTISSGDVIGILAGFGYDGTSFNNQARIRFVADEAWTTTARGTRIDLATTTNGDTTLTNRLSVVDNGDIGIGCANPDHLLELGGSGLGCNTGTGSWIAAGSTAFTANFPNNGKKI